MQLWSPEGEPTTGGNIGEAVRRNQERLKEGAGPAERCGLLACVETGQQRKGGCAPNDVCGLSLTILISIALPLPVLPSSAGPTVLRGIDPRIIAALTDNPELLRALVQVGTLCCAVQRCALACR